MAIRSYQGIEPNISDSAYVDDMALVIGDVTIEPDEPSESAAERGMKAVRLVPTASTRGRMRWSPDQGVRPSAS